MHRYEVRRTTYDKLQDALNAYAGEGFDVQVIFTGGRDYALVCRKQVGEYDKGEPLRPARLMREVGQ